MRTNCNRLFMHISTLFLLICGCERGLGLKWTLFDVPEWVKVGENTQLTCEFDLMGDPLYSVKWYKAEREIYRYVPAAMPIQMAFTMPGVKIDEKNSNDQHLVLKKVDFSTSGRYKCEVLTDGPFFKTLVKSEVLQVVDLPQGSPVLTGMKQEYKFTEKINITCATAPSVPPAILTWFINDVEATPSELAPRPYYHYNPSDISHPMSSSIRLEFLAQDRYFVDQGLMHLMCKAKIDGLHESRALHTARLVSKLRPSLLEGHTSGVGNILGSKLLTVAVTVMLNCIYFFSFHETIETNSI